MKKKKRGLSKRQLNKLKKNIQPVLSKLDQTNRLLKLRFGIDDIDGIDYVTDNGVIQNGWLITNKDCIKKAAKILEKQNAPIYILGEFFSAVFSWDAIHSTVIGSLWKNSKKVDESREIDMDKMALVMEEWFDKVTKGE
jgi:hypothetical protein